MKQTATPHLSAKQLRRAATIQEKIETLQAELSQLLGDRSPAEDQEPVKRKKKRRMSAAGRAKIAAAAKARWAKVRAAAK